jgi:short-subunit dehydrogenase
MLPQMQARKSGKIKLISSIAAFLPGPLHLIYGATKAFVLRFGEGLGEELKNSGVQVTVICPGPVATPFAAKVNFAHSKLFSTHLLSAEGVAQTSYQALMRGKRIVIIGWRSKLEAFFASWLPGSWTAKIVKQMMEA